MPGKILGDGVVDIGGSSQADRIKQTLSKKLFQPDANGRYFLPDILFSDDRGLAMWKTINQAEDYYQTDDEVELLEREASNIADYIPAGCSIIDLGCGDIRKVVPLLDTLESSGKSVTYYGLDLSLSSVEEGVKNLRSKYRCVSSHGLWGTFEDGLKWCDAIPSPRLFMSLGSIFGNDRFERAVKYLKPWADILRPKDLLLLGVDGCPDADTVWRSYHDPKGVFEVFIRNGFEASNRVLGSDWYKHDDWDVCGVLENSPIAHRFQLTAKKDVTDDRTGLHFLKGCSIECYEGFKYGPEVMQRQFSLAGLNEIKKWKSYSGRIYEYLVESLDTVEVE